MLLKNGIIIKEVKLYEWYKGGIFMPEANTNLNNDAQLRNYLQEKVSQQFQKLSNHIYPVKQISPVIL